MSLVDAIVTLYAFTPSDTAALEAELYDQLRLSYLERLRQLAVQHGVQNPLVTLGAAEEAELREKARVDAQSIADTYNRELRSQVEAIYNRNPLAGRDEYIRVLNSWGRGRVEFKSIQIAMYTILWSANYGFDLFVTRNNLQYQLFRAVGATPVCPDCMRIVAAGIVNFNYTQENPLPYHLQCSHEWSTVNASDLSSRGSIIWLGI